MVAPSAGSVVLVRFPFSDLSGSKVRPAVVVASVGRGDFVLCQITSNPYADANAVQIDSADFASGSLARVSFVRPAKIFTASDLLMTAEVGRLNAVSFARVRTAVHVVLA